MSGMLIGQFVPAESPIHRLSATGKILCSAALVVAVLAAALPAQFALAALFFAGVLRLSNLGVRFVLCGLRSLFLVFLFTFLLHVFLTEGREIWRWWIFAVTEEGIASGLLMLARLTLLVAFTTLLTLTTSPIDLADGIEFVLRPLAWVRFPVQEFALMLTIALRFIPILVEEIDKIGAAQRARGADFERGGPLGRLRQFLPVLIPLFVISFRRADELALAMESRCYRGGVGRTRYAVEAFGPGDALAVLVTAAFAVAYVVARFHGAAPLDLGAEMM